MSWAVPHPVQSSAIARPDAIAVASYDGQLTWCALRDRVARVAGAFVAQGLLPGQRIGLSGPPSLDWVVAFHAIGWCGGSVAPLPWKATDSERDMARRTSEVDRIIALDDDAFVLAETTPFTERDWPLDEERVLIQTSGSEGRPRPVALNTGQLLFSTFGSAIRLGHVVNDRWLLCLPLHHIGGLAILVRSAWLGITSVLHPRFDAAAVNAAIDRGEVSLVSLVPAMLRSLLDQRADRPFPTTLRVMLVGGAAASESLRGRAHAIEAPVAWTWGMSEAASQIATGAPGVPIEGTAVGAPLPFARVEARGESLWIRGPLVAGGAHQSADRGRVDADGQVHVLGRRDDIIVSGGKKIDPREVETALAAHPAVAEVAVVAREDQQWGQRPVAWLVAEAAAKTPSSDALRTWLRGRLNPVKCPDHFEWVSQLPRTALGKIRRGVLRGDPKDIARTLGAHPQPTRLISS